MPPNPSGKNGVDNGERPSDDVLRDALHQYARERLSLSERLDRLRLQFNYSIGETKLKKLNNEFAVPSARKTRTSEYTNQLVYDKMADDPNRMRGPETIKTLLALDGVHIPRDNIRSVMRTADPDGATTRYPGKKPGLKRGRLLCLGPMHQIHCDGHDKLGAFALLMDGVGIPMYGITDQSSSAMLKLVVVPNNRRADVIGHVYLDFVEQYECIAITTVFDKGSETGLAYGFQTGLREAHCKDINYNTYPAVLFLPSTRNTPIEGKWHWWREFDGYNLYSHITSGKTRGIFNGQDKLHVNLFYWIWPPIVQAACDKFVDWWNAHHIRAQRNKLGPSGTSPWNAFLCPKAPAQRVSIPVAKETVKGLRDTIPISREEAFRWVDDDFARLAGVVYAQIGSPVLDAQTAWDVFVRMANVIQKM